MYTKEELISQIKDKAIKRYLRENVSPNEKYISHLDMINSGFIWSGSIQGFYFWYEIEKHFKNFESRKITEVKTYQDFKHLDKSIK